MTTPNSDTNQTEEVIFDLDKIDEEEENPIYKGACDPFAGIELAKIINEFKYQ